MKGSFAFLWQAAILCTLTSVATTAQVTNLQVSKSGNDVVLAFSSTSGPWHVVRSTSPRFDYANILLANATTSNPLTDTNAVAQPELWFYDATDTAAGETPADSGQPSDEPIVLTSLSPNFGWEGQSITVNGTGFGATPTDNLVFFGSSPATVTGGTSTYLTVTIPIGVTACSVIVQRGGLTSNSLSFLAVMESSYAGNAFQNILSIVFNDRTTDATSKGHLFFGDTGTGLTSDYLYEVMNDYSLNQRAYFNEMKGLPMDAAGNIYLANTTYASNAGLIKKYDPATHALTTYTNGKQNGETNSVSIVGLALRSDGIVFLANRFDNTLRRRDPAGAGATIFATGYTWDLYMGMAMDSANTLYFTSGGTLYKTPTGGSASITTVATGFANASGIAIDESTGNTLLLLADRGTGNIYLINAQTGSMDLVGSGFTSPRAVAFGKDNISGELYYYVAEATRILRLPDPRIKLDSRISGGTIKVLISKKGNVDGYPCQLQSQDAQIRVPFDVEGKISAPTTVYAKLYDPKDPSSYAGGAENDNRDPAKNGGAGAGTFQACLSATSFSVDANNRHGEVILSITNRYAGDNYQIGFSFDPAFLSNPTARPLAKTGVLTAWKRLYVESERMYKQGGLLKQDIPSTATNTIYIQKDPNGILSVLPACSNPGTNCGYQIAIFDSANPVGSTTAQTAQVINAVDDPTPGSNQIILTLDHYLSGTTYQYSPPDFSLGRCAGIGVVGSGYYEANGTPFYQRMKDAFVEVLFNSAQNSTLPLISWSASFGGNNHWKELSGIWRDPSYPNYTRNNHIQLMGIENSKQNQAAIYGNTPGDTSLGLFSGTSLVYVQAILQNTTGYKQDQIDIISLHEKTHNFAIFCTVGNSEIYHCLNPSYSPPNDGAGCYMHLNPPFTPGVLPRPCLNHILTGGGGIVVVDTSMRDQEDPIP